MTGQHNSGRDWSADRLVTSLIRRNVMLKRVSVVIEAGTAEFKSLYRSGSTVLPNKELSILTDPEENSRVSAKCAQHVAQKKKN